jgi:hypothetical protein
MIKFLQIGLLTLQIDYHFDTYFATRVTEYELLSKKCDFSIESVISNEIPRESSVVLLREGKIDFCSQANFECIIVYDTLDRVSIKTRIDYDVINQSARVYLNPDLVQDLAMQEYVLFGAVFQEMALLKGYLTLHASAIKYDGISILFAAPSQVGKSTHARLWRERFGSLVSIINDDKPLIYMNQGNWMVCGSPFSGASSLQANVIVPLHCIVFLRQGMTNTCRRISSTEGLSELLKNTMHPRSERLWEKTLELVESLLQSTPLFLLDATVSQESVESVIQSINSM